MITIVGAESSGKTTLAMRLAEYFDCPWVPEYAREYLEGLGRPYNEEDLGIISNRQLEEINRQLAIGNEQRAIGKQQLAIGNGQKTIGNEQRAIGNRQKTIGNKQQEDEKNRQLAMDNLQFEPTPDSQFLIKNIKSLLVTRYSSLVIVDGGMMNMRMWARIKYNSTIQIVEDALKDDVTDFYLLCRPFKEWEPDPLREAPSIIDRAWIYNQYLEELNKSMKIVEILGGDENEKFNKAAILIEGVFKIIIDKMTRTIDPA